MDSSQLIKLNRLANEAISVCDSAIRFIKSISWQNPVDERDKEPLSWENGTNLIARYAQSYCDFFAEVKEYAEGARKEFGTTRRLSEYYYKKCKYLDRDIFHESYLVASKEFQPFLPPIMDFIFYYEREYEGARPKGLRERLRITHKDQPLSADELDERVKDAVNGFSKIRSITLEEDVTVIRYYSKKRPRQIIGPWWTFEKGTRESLAILQDWNDMDEIVVSRIRAGTEIYVGPAKQQGKLPGGQIQAYWFTPEIPPDAPRYPGITLE